MRSTPISRPLFATSNLATSLLALALLPLFSACSTSVSSERDSSVVAETPHDDANAVMADLDETSGNVLFVLTNHTQLGDTETPTGYYLSEVTHPWAVLTDAGFTVDFASPRGGPVTADPKSLDLDDPVNQRFWENDDLRRKLNTTIPAAEVAADRYDAIYFAGGHGTMWDFADDDVIQQLTARVWEAGGAVAAVCHGPAALLNVRLSNGDWLVSDRRVTGFTDAEERAVELEEIVPFLLETELRERGAIFDGADDFQENVIADGRLVTGQNPASATGVGQALVRVLTLDE